MLLFFLAGRRIDAWLDVPSPPTTGWIGGLRDASSSVRFVSAGVKSVKDGNELANKVFSTASEAQTFGMAVS